MATILQFKELVNRYRNLGRVDRRVELLREKLHLQYHRLAELEVEVAEAGRRTERLEKFHPAQLYAKFMNRHRKELTGAKQSYFDLAGRYNSLLAATELIEFELDVLTEKLETTDTVCRELVEHAMSGSGAFVRMFPELKARIRVSNKALTDYWSIKAETHEALIALARAKDALHLVESTLRQTGNSGSFLTTVAAAQRNRLMARAARQGEVVAQTLRQFMDHLKSMRRKCNRRVELKHSLQFRADYFARKFTKNWVYNRPLSLSRQAVRQSVGELENLRDQVLQLQELVASEIEAVTSDCKNLVLSRVAA